MTKKWTDSHPPTPARLPAAAGRAMTDAAAIVRTHRDQLARELDGPVNELVAAAAAPGVDRQVRQGIASAVEYLLSGVGLALGCPAYEGRQPMPPGTPCALSVKSSSGTSSRVVLRSRLNPADETPTLTLQGNGLLPRLQLVESVVTPIRLDRDGARQTLGFDRTP